MMNQPVRYWIHTQDLSSDKPLQSHLDHYSEVILAADHDAIVGAKDEQWRKTNAEYERVSKALCLAGKERVALQATADLRAILDAARAEEREAAVKICDRAAVIGKDVKSEIFKARAREAKRLAQEIHDRG